MQKTSVNTAPNVLWLLANAEQVQNFKVSASSLEPHSATLSAYGQDHALFFESSFSDQSALVGFLCRPAFAGLSVDWFGSPSLIGYGIQEKGGTAIPPRTSPQSV